MDIYTYIATHKKLLNQMPGFVQLNDLDYKIAFVNQKVSNLIGFTDAENVSGIRYEEMKCNAAKDYYIFERQDKLVFSTEEKVSVFCYHWWKTWTLFIYEKSPILNDQGEMIGSITYGTDITNYNLVDYSRFVLNLSKKFQQHDKKSFSYIIENGTTNKYKLSERQIGCLFFLLRGKTDKEIGNIFNLSPRTVESYIDEIKFKMGCVTRSQVIDKSFIEGLVNVIPKSFFKDSDFP